MSGDEKPAEAAVRLASLLRRSYLPLQGPPGTGKTYTGAEQIFALVAEGRAVGITAWSHAVIHQLIDTLCRRASARGVVLRIGRGADRENPFLHLLNVATSRAKAMAIIVASPDLIRGVLPDAAPDDPGERAVPGMGGTRLIRCD